MDYTAFVNVVKRDAYHRENSNNILFWKKPLVTFYNIFQALIAFFHNNAWKIIFIFDDIDDFTNHWVFEGPQPTNFAFSLSQQTPFLESLSNLIF
jgi:hypothetical protein